MLVELNLLLGETINTITGHKSLAPNLGLEGRRLKDKKSLVNSQRKPKFGLKGPR